MLLQSLSQELVQRSRSQQVLQQHMGSPVHNLAYHSTDVERFSVFFSFLFWQQHGYKSACKMGNADGTADVMIA